MTDTVRMLNAHGVTLFEDYINAVKSDGTLPVPLTLLQDPRTSEAMSFSVQIDKQPYGRPFKSAFELGEYLSNTVFEGVPKASISHSSGMWNWIALYLLEELCPLKNGRRQPLETPAYVIGSAYDYQRYYRHLVRTPWVLFGAHGQLSKVLLTTAGKSLNPVAVRSELAMQIGATQGYVESPSVIGAAYDLYFDAAGGCLKFGSGSSGAGSPRRLVAMLNQFDLTYDLHASPASTIVALLPKEFEKFKGKTRARPQVGHQSQSPRLMSASQGVSGSI